jgi:hypothetical protein
MMADRTTANSASRPWIERESANCLLPANRFRCSRPLDCFSERVSRSVDQGAGNYLHYGTLAEICVIQFTDHIKQIERWRGSQLVGFSATRLRAEPLEPELNAAVPILQR